MKLTQKTATRVKAPKSGFALHWDGGLSGFGLRVTANGAKSFILQYRIHGRQRRYTIGQLGAWTAETARQEAIRLQQEIDRGMDPVSLLEQQEQQAHEEEVRQREEEARERDLKQLADAYLAYFAERIEKDTRRPRTLAEYRALVDGMIIPPENPNETQSQNRKEGLYLGPMPIRELSERKIAEWHIRWKEAPYRANRALALLHAMFTWAIRSDAKARANQQPEEWYLPANPAAGVEKYHEQKRENYLTEAELQRLAAAMDEYPILCGQDSEISEKQRDWLQTEARRAMDALRLIMLTGCRKGEALSAKWADFDLLRGVWTKPRHSTKEKETEHVTLSQQALSLLEQMPREGEYLFPGRYERRSKSNTRFASDAPRHLADVKYPWARVCEHAKLSGWRIHDLRHSFASHLVSQGVSLETIGKLLGHRQAQTTKRYAHVADEAQRIAANKFPAVLASRTVQ
jgi:integrase